MSEKISFSAQARTLLGKKSHQLRLQNLIPANVSGDLKASLPISVEKIAFTKLYEKVGDTGLVYLQIATEKTPRPVLVNEVQVDPITAEILHVVFRQVDLTEKVSAEVPVELIGELTVKNAIVVRVQDEIKVSALPQDLPEKFEIDISQFTEFGQSITFEQLSYDKSKVELEVEADQLDTPVVLVQEIKEEVVEEVVAPAVEGEAAAAATPTEAKEGAAPAEKKPAEEKKD